MTARPLTAATGATHIATNGTANRITVSDEVRDALGDAYAFSGPETVEVKGKGPTRVWTLENDGG